MNKNTYLKKDHNKIVNIFERATLDTTMEM